LGKKDDPAFLAETFKNPALVEPLLITFELERTIFEENIEDIPLHISVA